MTIILVIIFFANSIIEIVSEVYWRL